MRLCSTRNRTAFTLIELLIVVAIIGILAAIAVPNFLNAQIRAKVSRTQSDMRMLETQNIIRQTDSGLWLVDSNDGGFGDKCKFQLPGSPWGKESTKGSLTGLGFWNGQIYAELTSPMAYIGGIPMDPFNPGVFYGYETRDCPNISGGQGAGSHYLLFAAGPDGDTGDWYTNRKAKPYQSSNGLISNGDVWISRKLKGQYYDEEQLAYTW